MRRLIDLYARAVPHYAASSLYAEIYKFLPNDTDMTPFLEAGITGFNFAFIGNGGQYHTPLDRHENIDPQSLQQQGENALGRGGSIAPCRFQCSQKPECHLSGCVGTLAAPAAGALVACLCRSCICS